MQLLPSVAHALERSKVDGIVPCLYNIIAACVMLLMYCGMLVLCWLLLPASSELCSGKIGTALLYLDGRIPGVPPILASFSRDLISVQRSTFLYADCSPDSKYEPVRARVNEHYITIRCDLKCRSDHPVSWFNEKNDLLLNETTTLLMLRNDGVQAIGGKCYKCQCENLSRVNEAKCYQIWG